MLSFFGLSSFFPEPGQVPLLKKVIYDHFQKPGLSVRNPEIKDALYYIWFTSFMTAFLVFLFMDSLLKCIVRPRRQRWVCCYSFLMPQFPRVSVLSGCFLICYKVGFCIWHVYMYLTFLIKKIYFLPRSKMELNLPLIYEIIWKPIFKIVALYTFQNWISALIVPNK